MFNKKIILLIWYPSYFTLRWWAKKGYSYDCGRAGMIIVLQILLRSILHFVCVWLPNNADQIRRIPNYVWVKYLIMRFTVGIETWSRNYQLLYIGELNLKHYQLTDDYLSKQFPICNI